MFTSSSLLSQQLFKAVENGDLYEVDELIKNGADLKSRDGRGYTLLHLAASAGHIEIVKYLVAKGADIKAIDDKKDETTAFHIACNHYHLDIANFLLNEGIDVNLANWFGTALYRAIVDWPDHYQDRKQLDMLIDLLWKQKPKAHIRGYNLELVFSALIQRSISKARNTVFPISLDLSGRGIGNQELEKLATIFKKNWPVAKLKLSDNQFSDGLEFLAETLKFNKNLKSLDLSYNNIGSTIIFDSGFQHLMKALETNNTLQHLDVSHCALNTSDIKTLITFLRSGLNKTLERIDFDVAENVLNGLSVADQNLIRLTQNRSKFLGVIDKCETNLAKFIPRYDQEKALFAAILEYLNQAKNNYSGEEKIDAHLIQLTAALLNFADVAHANQLMDLNFCLEHILQILYLEQSSLEEIKRAKPMDVFQSTLLNSFNSLYVAYHAINSMFVKNRVKTPIEKMARTTKDIILGFSGVGGAIKGSLGLVSEHLPEAINHGAAMIGETAEITNLLEIDINIEHVKDHIIRAVHHVTENDKAVKLVACFDGPEGAQSKFKSICCAILHHYKDTFANLTVDQAEIVAKYAYFHIADLLTSGKLQKLTAKELSEQVILWLSYEPMREDAVRVNSLTKDDIAFAASLFRTSIKLLIDPNDNDQLFECRVSSHFQDKLETQTKIHPPRLATSAEIEAIKQLLKQNHFEYDTSEIISGNHIGIKYKLIFDNDDLLKMKEKTLNVGTKLSTHQSKNKRIKTLENKVETLENNIKEKDAEIDNLKTEVNVLKHIVKKIEDNQLDYSKRRLRRSQSFEMKNTSSSLFFNDDKKQADRKIANEVKGTTKIIQNLI